MLRRVVWWKFTDVLLAARGLLIPLMMGAERTSETSLNFYQTTRLNITEESSSL
jgi:hypothetical protein